MPATPLMILVHPGSLCGSADHNLGIDDAEHLRRQVVEELECWEGDLLVLDGELSDELADYPDLDQAITLAISRAPALGVRLEADDPEHVAIALAFLQERCVAPGRAIALTGAWFDPSDRSGCINALLQALEEAGFSDLGVLNSAAQLDFYSDCDPAP